MFFMRLLQNQKQTVEPERYYFGIVYTAKRNTSHGIVTPTLLEQKYVSLLTGTDRNRIFGMFLIRTIYSTRWKATRLEKNKFYFEATRNI